MIVIYFKCRVLMRQNLSRISVTVVPSFRKNTPNSISNSPTQTETDKKRFKIIWSSHQRKCQLSKEWLVNNETNHHDIIWGKVRHIFFLYYRQHLLLSLSLTKTIPPVSPLIRKIRNKSKVGSLHVKKSLMAYAHFKDSH